jgi:hypothetical protein
LNQARSFTIEMAATWSQSSCTVVLHDSAVSREHVLCGSNILATGQAAYLISPTAKRLCVIPKEASRNPDEVSVHVSLARHFGFENRMKARIELVEAIENATASHIELFFREQHLSRADMWRMEAQINDNVLYEGQKLDYLGSNAASVETIYIAGTKVDSACVLHPQTKLIFRSGSARYIILVQVSKEMLENWSNGDLMYERLVNGFLPDLIQRWDELKVRHQVTVVLFGRALPSQKSRGAPQSDSPLDRSHDFFQVTAADVPSSDHSTMLYGLKKAFNDVKLPGSVSLAANGNMLEAINIAATEFVRDNIDPRLATTGSAIIAVTAGMGLFHAEHELLRQTTKLLMGNSVGMDIVSLSPKPLHPVPLFQYTLEGRTEFALPHWADISYWTDSPDTNPCLWLLPPASGDVEQVSIPLVNIDLSASTSEHLNAFDEEIFRSRNTESQRSSASVAPVNLDITASRKDNFIVRGKWPRPATPAPADANSENLVDTKSTDAQTTAASALPKPKISSVLPHPLMQIGRSISLGPKGLALSSGVASTSVSAHHAQLDKEPSNATETPVSDGSSILTKQIRASLKRKPSHKSFAASDTTDAPQPIPIATRTSEEQEKQPVPDPASLIEKAVLGQSASTGPDSGDSLAATPRIGNGFWTLPEQDAEEEHLAALSPWLTLLNPCNPRKDNMRVASEYRQWQNVFPTAVGPDTFRWESMKTPAVLPLQRESRISVADLKSHFVKSPRMLDTTVVGSEEAMRRMIALRLCAGSQVVPTRKRRDLQMPSDRIERMLLSLGDYYHELRCPPQAAIEVNEYQRQPPSHRLPDTTNEALSLYAARVQPIAGFKPQLANISLGHDDKSVSWSILDDQCVNPHLSNSATGHYQMRLVLIPVSIPPIESRFDSPAKGLSDEERRIEGIQKLTQLWQRNRHFSDEEQRHYASLNKSRTPRVVQRDPDPLAIEYQTRDPSAVVSAYGSALTEQPTAGDPTDALFPKSAYYHSTNFDIAQLVKRLQERPPIGVEVKDRRWFTRSHLKCFRGDQMTTWILRQFKDLETREHAVELGNQLMERGIFTHVRGQHEFRDGNYFYQIKGAYRSTAYPDSTGFFNKGIGWSVPSTPVSEFKPSPTVLALQGDSDSSGKGSPTPTFGPVSNNEIPTILLSQKLQYNVDPTEKSSQPEIINLHYGKALGNENLTSFMFLILTDRIHNPENCYHIQLDWTITTPRLIRESILRWSTLVEYHGLKMVQLPMSEASKLHEHHPLEQTIAVKLAMLPPDKVPVTPHLDPHGASPRSIEERHEHHKAILRKNDFVLDLEAAKSFPRKLDIAYSWGRPDYEYTQFIHKSGLLLAQITSGEKCDFVLLRNTLAGQWAAVHGRRSEDVTVESIMMVFVKFCKDPSALKAVYEEVSRHSKVSPMSPLVRSPWMADADVPPMELPAHLTHRTQR